MRTFSKPKVIMSRCLGFDACRYNGEIIIDDFIQKVKHYVECRTVCPEVEIGLGVPRDSIRLEEHHTGFKLIQFSNGLDLSSKMNQFATSFVNNLKEIDGFILKSKSPSCAIHDAKVYDGSGKEATVLRRDAGLFTAKIQEHFPHLAIEDEARLQQAEDRDHFFIKLFTISQLRQNKEALDLEKLQSFHSQNKYLFMAYNQALLKELGILVANHQLLSLHEVYHQYTSMVYKLLAMPVERGGHYNTLQHIFGYFSKLISGEDKLFFLNLIEGYLKGEKGLSEPRDLLLNWARKYNQVYLLQQTYFEPYPVGLSKSELDIGINRNKL